MKTEWDFTNLAQAYLKRPDYSDEAIDEMLSIAKVPVGAKICDIGAGLAHLTLKLLERGMIVSAVEPNDEMRRLGSERTKSSKNVRWFEGIAEKTGMPAAAFDMVTFGASFNATDRPVALKETKRILKQGCWFAALFNHRDLNDPLQKKIEKIITETIPNYDYGTRREDQTPIIDASGLFKKVHRIEKRIIHTQPLSDVVEAWRSHSTLHRQSGNKFNEIISRIEKSLLETNQTKIATPYITRIWLAQLA